jgi:polyisoprenoid-binding protein YceI
MTTLQSLSGTYVIDPAHSQIGFVARHAMVTKVRGTFDESAGSATVDGDLASAQVEVTIQAASINTRNADRDNHLRTGDFLEAETYPTITFRSTDAAADGNTLNLTGDLTIKDTTRQVTVPFEFGGAAQDPFGNERVGFEGSAVINRQDYGVSFSAPLETGGVLVSDKITLEFEISAIKQA